MRPVPLGLVLLLTYQEIPSPGTLIPGSRPNRETGEFPNPDPDSRPNRESGIGKSPKNRKKNPPGKSFPSQFSRFFLIYRPGNPFRPPNRHPDSRSRPNRETGIPSPFPGKKPGIGGGSDSRFPSDVRASTAVDSEYTQPRVSCQCSHRQHAAPIQGLRDGACCCE
jgi:hypothetical protein